MIPDIPICPLIFVIINAFSYCELVGRGCEKAHEGKPTSCGLLNGVHSVRHYASHLLFLTSFLNVWVLILKNAHVSIWAYKMERQALLSWSIVSPCRMNVNIFLKIFLNLFSTWFRLDPVCPAWCANMKRAFSRIHDIMTTVRFCRIFKFHLPGNSVMMNQDGSGFTVFLIGE